MIRSFSYYLQNKLATKTIPNISRAKSLIEKAEVRFSRILKSEITEEESSVAFEDIYEVVREAAQSLMELGGYRPYSHEALIAFLQEGKYLDEGKINVFNSYRILRNNSVYQAEKISIENCKEALNFAKRVLSEIKQKAYRIIGDQSP